MVGLINAWQQHLGIYRDALHEVIDAIQPNMPPDAQQQLNGIMDRAAYRLERLMKEMEPGLTHSESKEE